MKSIEKIFGKAMNQNAFAIAYVDTTSFPPYVGPLTILNEDVFIGIEIEVEHVRAFSDPLGIWGARGDGSLRNHGMEWASVPLKGRKIVQALNHFFDLLFRSSKEYHFSPRTSIHIHMDVRHLLMEELVKILVVYLSVEPLLYKFVGGDRDKGVFCVPLADTYLVNDLTSFMRNGFMMTPWENHRYAGLNIGAVPKFGSLEFRHLGGTDDITRIVTWINLILSIYNFARNISLGDLIHKISELNTNSYYVDFIHKVFGGLTSNLDLSSIKLDLEKGVKAVKQSTLNNKMHHTLLNDVSERSKAIKWYKKRSGRSIPNKKISYSIEPNVVFQSNPGLGFAVPSEFVVPPEIFLDEED